jgi:LAS superfamily LD-carboxypeptidase LdcB
MMQNQNQNQNQNQWLFEAPIALETGSTPTNSSPYVVVAQHKYGPKWKSQQPPGLPMNARLTSQSGAAIPEIEQLARSQGLGEVFITTVRHLAQTESGAMFGRPANIFNALPGDQRQGKPLITAWGAFQFNRDAWRSLNGVASTAFPWNSTPYEEISRPIQKYAELFTAVRALGGSEIDAARGVRLWHVTPAGYLRYLRNGRQNGFLVAWQSISQVIREKIDRYLNQAHVLSEQSHFSNQQSSRSGGGRVKLIIQPDTSRITTIKGYNGKKVPLLDQAAQAYLKLIAAARNSGIKAPYLDLISGFRSIAHQKRLWEVAKKKYGSETEARKWVAPPGKSVHQTGRAIDVALGFGISSKNIQEMRKTQAYRWLVQNAAAFGFYPYDREPWHWEYNPPT